MWPQALQMTREECRGVLRRLELESYSHVISVFRAQGGLTDSKAKLLEELRGIFHISQERHRAEARRVANDEQLATIAEAISGPNTWQEWSREGRRSFPLLPRVAPQTALALIANNVATETAAENAKLPYPSDTAAAVADDQMNRTATHDSARTWDGRNCANYVVSSDPFKMPEIPAAGMAKKNLKRNLPDYGQSGGASKKRVVNDLSPIKQQQQHHHHQHQNQLQQQQQQLQQQHQQHQLQMKPYQHITASTNANVPQYTPVPNNNINKKLQHNHNKVAQSKNSPQQTQKSKALAKKVAALSAATMTAEAGAIGAMTMNANTPTTTTTIAKRQATPAKCGRRAQKMQQQRKPSQLKLHLQSLEMQQISSEAQPAVQLDFGDEQMVVMDIPQIAASKKDISKNLTKLQIQTSTSGPTVLNATPMPISSPTMVGAAAATSPLAMGGCRVIGGDKTLLSTPVQKYIVEDRQPPLSPHHISSSPQIMTLPQLTNVGPQLRTTANTSILPAGTKLTTKKGHVALAVQTGTPTLLEPIVIDGSEGKTLTNDRTIDTTQLSPVITTAIMHTPPAIIQLPGVNNSTVTQPLDVGTQQTVHGKVLTRKLMPIVLSSTSGVGGVGNLPVVNSGSGSGNLVNITKIETLNNGATIIGPNTNQTMTGSTIIKNLLTPTVLIAGQSSGGGVGGSGAVGACGTSISAITTGTNTVTTSAIMTGGTAVFRKPPGGVIKTGIIGVGAGTILSNSNSVGTKTVFSTSTSNTGGPQIISNIKLTPATNAPIVAATVQQQQQFLKTVPTAGLRTPVKICQSPNGKVFIQPASKLSTVLPTNKLLTATGGLAGGGGSGTTAAVVRGTSMGGGQQHQRIAIQKVQIIPAPCSSGITTPSKPTAIAIGSGNIGNSSGQKFIMPVTSVRAHTTGTITLNKSGSLFTSVMAKVQHQHQHQQQQHNAVSKDVPKSNVVVIGAATLHPQSSQQTATTSKMAAESNNIAPLDAAQMITEDTPVDILNTPISINETEPNDLIGVTDWEMELDQATAVAAATKTRNQQHNLTAAIISVENSPTKKDITMFSTASNMLTTTTTATTSITTSIIDNATVFLDDCFEDVIVEEHECDELQDEQEDLHTHSHCDGKEEVVVAECQKLTSQADNVGQMHQTERYVGSQLVNTPYKSTGGEFDNADAGFDETIADYTETDDENTAIEYIEDDRHDPEERLVRPLAVCLELSEEQATESNKLPISTSTQSNVKIYDGSSDVSNAHTRLSQDHKDTDDSTDANKVSMKTIDSIAIMAIQDDVVMSIECNNHADNIDEINSKTVNNAIVPVSMAVAATAHNQL